MSKELKSVLNRWLRQGYTDDNETPLDEYGKRVVREVIQAMDSFCECTDRTIEGDRCRACGGLA